MTDRPSDRPRRIMVWQPEPRASEGGRKRWPKNNGSARAEREGRKTIFTQLVIIVEEREAEKRGRHAGGEQSERSRR